MRNVLAMIPGKNTKEYVIVGAHFDHLGIDPALDGDQIYNGADDNASGVSAVLQIARAFLASGQQPERNVILPFGTEKKRDCSVLNILYRLALLFRRSRDISTLI